MNILDTDLVADIVKDNPGSTAVFETYGIDFCCNGKISLKDACFKKGIIIEKILTDLQDVANPKRPNNLDWSKTSITELVDDIVETHHKFLERELPRLSQLCQKVRDVHREKHPELIELSDVFNHLKNELEQHLMKEERILFPISKQLENSKSLPTFHCGSVINPIMMMEKEHDEAGVALTKMRSLTQNYEPPLDACPSYISLLKGLVDLELDLHIHIHKENNILFPKVNSREQQLRSEA